MSDCRLAQAFAKADKLPALMRLAPSVALTVDCQILAAPSALIARAITRRYRRTGTPPGAGRTRRGNRRLHLRTSPFSFLPSRPTCRRQSGPPRGPGASGGGPPEPPAWFPPGGGPAKDESSGEDRSGPLQGFFLRCVPGYLVALSVVCSIHALPPDSCACPPHGSSRIYYLLYSVASFHSAVFSIGSRSPRATSSEGRRRWPEGPVPDLDNSIPRDPENASSQSPHESLGLILAATLRAIHAHLVHLHQRVVGDPVGVDGVVRHGDAGGIPDHGGGCMAHGNDQEAAHRKIKDAMQFWIESALELGRPISEPKCDDRLMFS